RRAAAQRLHQLAEDLNELIQRLGDPLQAAARASTAEGRLATGVRRLGAARLRRLLDRRGRRAVAIGVVETGAGLEVRDRGGHGVLLGLETTGSFDVNQ